MAARYRSAWTFGRTKFWRNRAPRRTVAGVQGRRRRWPAPTRPLALLLVGCAAALGAAGDGSPAGISPAATVTTEVTAIADAYVRSDAPSTRFGTSSELWADSSPIARSYLRFQVSGVSGTV